MNLKLRNQISVWVDNNSRFKSDSQSGIGLASHSQSFHPVNSGIKSHSNSEWDWDFQHKSQVHSEIEPNHVIETSFGISLHDMHTHNFNKGF